MQLPKQFKRKQQAGFIQNFIIPGIILIGVVIAGIAMLASNSGGSDTSNEKAAMVANTVVGQGLSVTEAIQRAQADGSLPLAGGPEFIATTTAELSAVLVGGKYLTALPSKVEGVSAPNWRLYLNTPMQLNHLGLDRQTSADVVFQELGGTEAARSACYRINKRVLGDAYVMDQNDALPFSAFFSGDGGLQPWNNLMIEVSEGCASFDNGTGQEFTYFKILNTNNGRTAPIHGGGGEGPGGGGEIPK